MVKRYRQMVDRIRHIRQTPNALPTHRKISRRCLASSVPQSTISWLQVYRDHGPFLVHKIGTMYRIPKESIDNWFYGKKTEK